MRNLSGRIELIIGSMYSNKSTELIKQYNRYNAINKNIIVVNHSINNRYGTNSISTHDKTVLDDCIILDKLSILRDKYEEMYQQSEIIIIEEVQFFPDAFDFITNAADIDHKIVIAAGLNGDFNRKPFENVVKLIPHAEKITKLSALCKQCSDGTYAHFSKLIVNNVDKDDQIVVGGLEKYEAVCRKHYLENTLH